MPRSYKPLDLPNLIHLTAPENLEFMERMEAEEEAKKKTKAPTKAATVSKQHFAFCIGLADEQPRNPANAKLTRTLIRRLPRRIRLGRQDAQRKPKHPSPVLRSLSIYSPYTFQVKKRAKSRFTTPVTNFVAKSPFTCPSPGRLKPLS